MNNLILPNILRIGYTSETEPSPHSFADLQLLSQKNKQRHADRITELAEFLSATGRKAGDLLYIRCMPPGALKPEELLRLGIAFKNDDDKIVGSTREGILTIGAEDGTGWMLTQPISPYRTSPKVFTDGLQQLEQWNRQGRGIYYVVCSGGRTDKEITHTNALFYEFDGLSFAKQWEVVRQVEEAFETTLTVVETRKSLHVYLPLAEPVLAKEITERLIQLTSWVESDDPGNVNASRLLRLPGFDHIAVQRNANGHPILIRKPVELKQSGIFEDEGITELQLDAVLGALSETIEQAKSQNRQTISGKPSPASEAVAQRRQKASGHGSQQPGSPIGDTFDIRNLSQFLPGYDPEGRTGYITCQCPVHNGLSYDSLHIRQDNGAFKCHHGCNPKDIYRETAEIARATGYEFSPRPTKRSVAAALRKKFKDLYSLDFDGEPLRQKFIPDLDLPVGGGILLASSPTGSGKTYQLIRLKQQFLELHPDGLFELWNYRNMLGIQTAGSLGSDHIHDFKGAPDLQTAWILNSSSMSYCVESLYRRIAAIRCACLNGIPVAIILDEMDAFIQHALMAKTLTGKREDVIEAVAECLILVIESGGWIIGAEHNLPQMSLDFIQELVGTHVPVTRVVNAGLPRPEKKITFYQAEDINGKIMPSAVANNRIAFAHILKCIEEGERLLLCCDAQNTLEQIEKLLENEGEFMRRLDSSTANGQRDFMRNPGPELEEDAKLNVHLGLTSTAESGFDLPQGHFDRIILIGNHLTPRALYQMQNRDRSDAPVDAFVLTKAIAAPNWTEADLNVDEIVKGYRSLAGQAAGAALEGLDDGLLTQVRSQLSHTYEHCLLSEVVHRTMARYEIRKRLGQIDLRGELEEICQQQGFTIEHHRRMGQSLPEDPQSAALTQKIKDAKNLVTERNVVSFIDSDLTTMTLEQAKKLRRNGEGDRQQQQLAQKIVLAERFPGLPLHNPEFVAKEVINGKGRNLRKQELLWMSCNLDVAKLIDQKSWQHSIDSGRKWVIGHEQSAITLKAALISQSGIDVLMQMTEKHGNHTPEKIAVHKFLYDRAPLMKQLFGYEFSPNHSPNTDVNKFLKGLGFKKIGTSQYIVNGRKEWHYSFELGDSAQRVWEALEQRYEKSTDKSLTKPESSYTATGNDTSHTNNSKECLCINHVTGFAESCAEPSSRGDNQPVTGPDTVAFSSSPPISGLNGC